MQKLLSLFDFNSYKQGLIGLAGKFFLTALLIFIPLFPKFPTLRLANIYVSIRLEDFLILITLFIFIIPLLKNLRQIMNEKITRAILLFLLVGLISTLSAVFLTQTVSFEISFLHWLRRLEYLSVFFVGFIYIKYLNQDKNIFEYLIKVLLLINIFIFLYGLGQKYLSFPVITTQNEEYSKGVALRWVPGAHINSTFAGHYDLASYLVLTMPIFITSFFLVKHKWSRLILGLSVFFGFWLFSSAVSRISIVAFLLASLISLLIYKKFKEIIIFSFVSLVIFSFSPDLRSRYNRIIEVVKDKITSAIVVYGQESEVFEDRSTSIRLNVEWPRAIRALIKNPILGTGYSSISLATDNDYLRSLGETGILGFAAFVLIFVNIFRNLKSIKFGFTFESIFKAGFVGSTIAILLTAVFIDIFEASKFATTYWLFAGIVLGSNNSYE